MAKDTKSRRRPGRPPMRFKSRSRFNREAQREYDEADVTSPSLLPPEPSQELDQPPNPSQSSVPPLTADEAMYASLNTMNLPGALRFWGCPPCFQDRDDLFLNSVPRNPPNWTYLGSVHTTDLPDWFDAQMNDYNKYKSAFTDVVDVVWFGHPGDSPLDLRARQFIVKWRADSLLPVDDRSLAANEKRIALRWEYICRGICSVVAPESDDERSAGSEAGGDAQPTCKEHIGRWNRCGGRVKLVIEVTADDLSQAHLWQCGTHPDATLAQGLQWSRRLRNEISASIRRFGVKPTTIMKDLVMQYTSESLVQSPRPSTKTAYSSPPYPEFRRPMMQHIQQLAHACSRRARSLS